MNFRFSICRTGGLVFALASSSVAFTSFWACGTTLASPSEALAPSLPSPSKDDAAGRWLEARARHHKDESKTDAKSSDAKDAKKPGKPQQVAKFDDWGVFVAQSGKEKTCYALASPKERTPKSLKRDDAYVFISNGPGADVRGEVSIIMGFAVKEDGDARAEVGGSSVELVAKGNSAWVKNLAKQAQFVEALKGGSKLVVKAPSAKGNVTTDAYSLSGLKQALDRVQKECP
ncbi:invasion associated locus B family protein [Methylocapsa acidiphila]|uniref:invasion associated locus B family protein n=1 Tax=Methylocapsa acidiphila TaxID=133552 RepID=UPI00040DB035|nr:invasion associated locus B family protein [Methylocapsa acidiphila]